MKNLTIAAALTCALAATPALAQEAASEAAPAVEPAVEAAAPTAAPITDAELDQFAGAAIKVNDIAQDAALSAEDKQAAMVEAVTGSGLAAERFNEIASKSQSDETLKARLGEAFARRPAPAATAAADAEAEAEEQTGG